jgi:hypothetical protein
MLCLQVDFLELLSNAALSLCVTIALLCQQTPISSTTMRAFSSSTAAKAMLACLLAMLMQQAAAQDAQWQKGRELKAYFADCGFAWHSTTEAIVGLALQQVPCCAGATMYGLDAWIIHKARIDQRKPDRPVTQDDKSPV